MEFSGKNILITGSSSGIGYQLCKDFAKEGANLALLARRKNILDDLANELKSSSSKIITTACDVTSPESVKTSYEYVKKEFGHFDLVILNSGVSHRMTVEEFDSLLINETFNVNLIGVTNCLNEMIPDFMKWRKGIIAGVSSLAEVRGFPRSAAYCASKAAVSIFLESIRIELKKYNVKVITIKPGFIKTPLTEKNEFHMPFLINPEKACQYIIKGLRKEKKVIQFPLPTVIGDKIIKYLPNFLFDYFMSKPLPPKKISK